MKKIISIIVLFIAIGITSKAQVLSVSDTIHELSFFSISQVSGDTIYRSSTRYSPMDEDVNQNFRNLRIEKVKVDNNIFYVLTYLKDFSCQLRCKIICNISNRVRKEKHKPIRCSE